MKKSNVLALFLSSLFAFLTVQPAFADLDAVVAAEREGQRIEAARAKAAAKARAEKARALAEAKAKEQAKRDAEKERAYQDAMADKKRDQSYEDELRKLEIEDRKAELLRKQKRVSREDDFIEQELKREAARTDVVQSEADSNRSYSQGAESWMKQDGEARVKKESGFFK